VLECTVTFSPELDESFFQKVPAVAAVFLLRGDGQPYVSKTANLRRRLQRLLRPPTELSKRLNLRERVREIEFTPTGSDFESQFLLYRLLRETFPKTYSARLRIRPAPLVKLHLENEYPRASVTTRLGKLETGKGTASSPADTNSNTFQRPAWNSCPSRRDTEEQSSFARQDSRERPSSHSPNLYYGPFPSRAAAEKFASDALDFFKMRRCVEELHPDPEFPGCVYSEMKMCLAPCFKGCTNAEYHAEVARVQRFFDTAGESLNRELTEQRERASAELAFEEAAAIHTKIEKLKPLLSQLPEIVQRIDRLRALIIEPSAAPPQNCRAERESSVQSTAVSLFLFQACTLHGPIEFSIERRAESQSMESRVEEAIASFAASKGPSTTERMEHLALVKRWYYRSHRVGEIFFADEKGSWPLRRMVRGIGRVYRGEKSQDAAPFSATAALPPTSEPA
jgi:excinuclease ABC subunit C